MISATAAAVGVKRRASDSVEAGPPAGAEKGTDGCDPGKHQAAEQRPIAT